MSFEYFDPRRENHPTALPDCEVFYVRAGDALVNEEGEPLETGYYWRPCFPGCLPGGDASGPFATAGEALADAREDVEENLIMTHEEALNTILSLTCGKRQDSEVEANDGFQLYILKCCCVAVAIEAKQTSGDDDPAAYRYEIRSVKPVEKL